MLAKLEFWRVSWKSASSAYFRKLSGFEFDVIATFVDIRRLWWWIKEPSNSTRAIIRYAILAYKVIAISDFRSLNCSNLLSLLPITIGYNTHIERIQPSSRKYRLDSPSRLVPMSSGKNTPSEKVGDISDVAPGPYNSTSTCKDSYFNNESYDILRTFQLKNLKK